MNPIVITFNPENAACPQIREIFEDTVARNLWLLWKRKHITDVFFPKHVLATAAKLKANPPTSVPEAIICFPNAQTFLIGDVKRFVEEYLPYLHASNPVPWEIQLPEAPAPTEIRSKQVLVMRKFPSLRTGKYCAQAAHASGNAILSAGKFSEEGDELVFTFRTTNPAIKHWFRERFTKIVLSVKTEEELRELHEQAKSAGILCSLITDAGTTEFKGEPTITALALGPDFPEKLDPITKHLPLF